MDDAAVTVSQNHQSVGQPDLAVARARAQAAWSSGDYALIGTILQFVGEELCKVIDVRPGQKVVNAAAAARGPLADAPGGGRADR